MKNINLILKVTVRLILGVLVLMIIKFNISLYYTPEFEANELNDVKFNVDVYNQLRHLKEEINQGAADEMQLIYPEGSVFLLSLYALSWIDLISKLPEDSKIFKEGIIEVTNSLNKLRSEKAKSIFPKDLPLKYGAFYRGWTNYVLGSKLKIQSPQNRDTFDLLEFKRSCEEINYVLENQSSPYIESYQGYKWPADGIIAVSSLKLFSEVEHTEKYQEVLKDWMASVRNNLDEETGLIPHSINAETDQIIEGARGSSQSLILNFIKDIDKNFSLEQFKIYQSKFLDYRMGMPGIREYPDGKEGRGDIDSGPVILGIGGAASIVGQRAMGNFGEWTLYTEIRNSIESFGMPVTLQSKKKYLFGTLPMADAFIAWSNSIEKSKIDIKGSSWRFRIQLTIVILLAILGMLMFKI